MGPSCNRGSWGPCVLAHIYKKPIKGTRGISWGPLLTPGPQALPECSNGQSTPGFYVLWILIRPVTLLSQLSHQQTVFLYAGPNCLG
ncbi:unnamed protein product [Staurois parvus]|uniref:Uncharacterized protein n=1 Tax=Staurois parvus TaxID=386267 RepID=A0ABN9CE32_9NEOB|nr:unnamed protein product [Staurois parvus]